MLNLRLRVLNKLKLPEGLSVLKPLIPVVSTEKSIKTKLSPENICISRLSQAMGKTSFHKKIMEKYDFLKRSSMLFPDLMFFKLTSSDSAITNTNVIKSNDRNIRPQFNITFFLLGREKTIINRRSSQNICVFPNYWEQAKPNTSTVYWTLTNWDLTFRLFNAKNESTSFYSKYRHLTLGIPGTSLFQKLLNSPLKEKEFRELGFRHFITDIKRIFFSHNLFLPQIFKDSFLLSKRGYTAIPDSGNLKYLLIKPGILNKALRISDGKFQLRGSDEKFQYPEDMALLETFELQKLKSGFLIKKLWDGKKSDRHTLIMEKSSKLERRIPDPTLNPLNSVNLRYANPYESVSKSLVTTNDKGKIVFRDGRDMVLRKTVVFSSKANTWDIQENEPEHMLKKNTRILPEKNNSYAVSPADINNIVNKVYRLLEKKLLIEKERRGLR